MQYEDALREYRTLRQELEEAVLPLASSIDGETFSIQASLHGLELEVGGYVAIDTRVGHQLGQVTRLGLRRVDGPDLIGGANGELRTGIELRVVEGEGRILDGPGRPFHDGTVRPAAPAEVQEWLDRVRPNRAALRAGALLLAEGVPLELDAGGFGRHTFFCGQSGSGKTYALGAVLERLLLETELRIIVLDPNSDATKLAETRPDADPELVARYARVAGGVAVRSATSTGEERLRLRAAELDPAVQAAILRLDPIRERREYAALLELLELGGGARSLDDLAAIAGDAGPAASELLERVRSLRVDRWDVWARGQQGSILDELGPDGPRLLVVDLGSLPTRDEQALVSEAVLGELWRRRAERAPVLVVIDEAHNVCPAVPEDEVTALATQHAIRIAAEGRKFGIHLLVATQRPQKVHDNVVSQCDNLVLMRMNSTGDLAHVAETFSFVPAELLALASSFGLGESLVAGKIVSHPTLARFGPRIALEGGSDVPATWAAVRAT